MVPYLVVITLYSYFLFISEKMRNKNLHSVYYLISFLAILGISIFAGVRHLKVGIDIEVYGRNIFEGIVFYGPQQVLDVYSRWADPGYVYFNYLISFVTDNIYVFLGSLQFFLQLSFILFFRKYRDIISPTLAILVLNSLIFPLSFNLLRQTMAMAVAIWIYYFLTKNKYILTVITSILSFYLHKSSILLVLIIILLFCYTKIKEKINERRLLGIILILSILLSMALIKYPDIINLFLGDLNISNVQVQTAKFGSFARLAIFIAPVLYARKINKGKFVDSNESYFLYLLSIVVIAFSWLSGINYSISRFTSYLYAFYVLFIAIQCKKSKNKRSGIYFIIWAIIASWWLIYRMNEGGIIPYLPYWKEYIN